MIEMGVSLMFSLLRNLANLPIAKVSVIYIELLAHEGSQSVGDLLKDR